MIDEIFDRQYQAARARMHADLSAPLAKAGRAMFQSFKVLNRIEYQAPWATEPKKARCN